MRDEVVIVVRDGRGGTAQISDFMSYEIDSDIFAAASAFTFKHFNPALPVYPGQLVNVFVNNSLEHTGIIDKVESAYDKKGRQLVISGRDMMGLLCDHHCKNFSKSAILDGKTFCDVVKMLLADVPFIKPTVVFQDGIGQYDKAYDYEKIDVGETVFEVLKRLATGRGLLFYCRQDGTFVLGKPRDRGAAEYSLICKKSNPRNNNVLSATMTGDISEAYSEITVTGQVQGSEKIGTIDGVEIDAPSAVNVKATACLNIPTDFPFYKPQVVKLNKDFTSAKREASRLIERQKSKMFCMEYTVPYHSQNSKIWHANEIVHVEDENFMWKGRFISGDFLIYSRVFERDKNHSVTRLKLGPYGKVIADGSFEAQPADGTGYAYVEGTQG